MIIGGTKLKIELQEVFETGLAYRVLEQTLPIGYEGAFIKSRNTPQIQKDKLFIRGRCSDYDTELSCYTFNTPQERSDYIAKVKQAVEEISKPEPLTFERIKKECVPMKHLLVDDSGDKRLYLGFNRVRTLVTDGYSNIGSTCWSECEVKNWTIEPYEVE